MNNNVYKHDKVLIFFNGSNIDPIMLKRGLRHGDPLLPIFIFILCGGFISSYKTGGRENEIHRCKVSHSSPSITHILYYYLLMIVSHSLKLSMWKQIKLKEILNSNELSSGQAVNNQKSGIFFSSNVRRDKKLEVMNILGVTYYLSSGNYLGLPSSVGRSKNSVFGFLKDRIWKKIQGWNVKLLSKADKDVLLKYEVTTILSYCMSGFMLPTGIERILNGFWWNSSSTNNRKIHWLSWDVLSNTKTRMGLEF